MHIPAYINVRGDFVSHSESTFENIHILVIIGDFPSCLPILFLVAMAQRQNINIILPLDLMLRKCIYM
jgi:hypothetical protein